MKHRYWLWALMLMAATVTFPQPGVAQPGLESYALPHLFALPTASTTRLMGMGGFVACVEDAGFANPAFAGTLDHSRAVGRFSHTSFDSGPSLRGWQVSAAFPLREDREGFQVTWFNLDSGTGTTLVGPAMSLEEQNAALHYGRRFGEAWSVGLGISPLMRTNTWFTDPQSGALLGELESEGKLGLRVGTLYQFGPQSWAGVLFDSYRESVTGSGMLFGGVQKSDFTSTQIALGVSSMIHEQVRAAIEWEELTTKGAGAREIKSGLRLGAEWMPEEQWSVRVGSNDGAFGAGLGFQERDWSFQYAYVDGWNRDKVKDLFGGSCTHQFEVRYRW